MSPDAKTRVDSEDLALARAKARLCSMVADLNDEVASGRARTAGRRSKHHRSELSFRGANATQISFAAFPDQFDKIFQYAGAARLGHNVATVIWRDERRALIDAIGEERRAFAMRHRFLAQPLSKITIEELIAAISKEVEKCRAVWIKDMPKGLRAALSSVIAHDDNAISDAEAAKIRLAISAALAEDIVDA